MCVLTFRYIAQHFSSLLPCYCRSQLPRDLRRRSTAACLLRSWVRIPPGAWISVCCECCVLSGRGLCEGLITRPEDSYQLWCVVVCDQETSTTRRLKPATGLCKIQPRWVVTPGKQQTNKQTSYLVIINYPIFTQSQFSFSHSMQENLN